MSFGRKRVLNHLFFSQHRIENALQTSGDVEKISSWREEVEPGGDHISDVSAPVSKAGTNGTFSVHPKDSASCGVPSPESSVVSAPTSSQKRSQTAAPPASTDGSTTLSVNIQPPTPKKGKILQKSALQVSSFHLKVQFTNNF